MRPLRLNPPARFYTVVEGQQAYARVNCVCFIIHGDPPLPPTPSRVENCFFPSLPARE